MSQQQTPTKRRPRTARSNSTSESLSKTLLALFDVLSEHPVEVGFAIAHGVTTSDGRFADALLSTVRDACGDDARSALVKRAIDDEVASTLGPTQLFRTGSAATRLMGSVLHTDCAAFLAGCLTSLLDDCARATAARSLEVDPQRAPGASADELARNVAEIETITQRFLDRLWASAGTFPRFVSEILEHAKTAAEARFPVAHGGVIAVTGLLFLRCVAPAVVSPEMWGVPQPQELSADARRVLVVISRVLQTVANGTIVDSPQSFMHSFNPLIQRNFDACRRFMVAVSTIDSPPPVATSETQEDGDTMPKSLRDALKIVLKELEGSLGAVLDALRENLELQQIVHDIVKPSSKAMQSARRIFGKTIKPSKQSPVQSALGQSPQLGSPPAASPAAAAASGGAMAEDSDEESLRRSLHKKVDDVLNKLHEKLSEERQKRMQAEAELARFKGLEDELHRERELRTKAEKELRKARDEIESLKRKGAKGSKAASVVEEDSAAIAAAAAQLLSPSESSRKLHPGLSGSFESLQGSPSAAAGSPQASAAHARGPSYVQLPVPIPSSVQLQATTPEADIARTIVKSLDEIIAQLPTVDSAAHLVYIGRIARELRKLERIPLEEDYQLPTFPSPARNVSGAGLDSEQMRSLRQVVPAVLQDVRAFVMVLGSNTGVNVLRRLYLIPPVLSEVLGMLTELRSQPAASPQAGSSPASIPPPPLPSSSSSSIPVPIQPPPPF